MAVHLVDVDVPIVIKEVRLIAASDERCRHDIVGGIAIVERRDLDIPDLGQQRHPATQVSEKTQHTLIRGIVRYV